MARLSGMDNLNRQGLYTVLGNFSEHLRNIRTKACHDFFVCIAVDMPDGCVKVFVDFLPERHMAFMEHARESSRAIQKFFNRVKVLSRNVFSGAKKHAV